MKNFKREILKMGHSITTKEKGNSMLPLIKSNQLHTLSPTKWEDCEKNDIVYCKVKGRYYTHLVYAKDPKKGLLIGNNKKRMNGWTKEVFGKVIKIYE